MHAVEVGWEEEGEPGGGGGKEEDDSTTCTLPRLRHVYIEERLQSRQNCTETNTMRSYMYTCERLPW